MRGAVRYEFYHSCRSNPPTFGQCYFAVFYLLGVIPLDSTCSIWEMSDVPGAVKKGLQDLKDEITCPVCQEFFQDPKILPCFHYYCKRCVLQLAAREQPFPCPECRGDTLLPPTGADGFPTAFFVNRMKSLHGAMEKVQGATSSGDLICEQCHSDKAVAFCRHCAQYHL